VFENDIADALADITTTTTTTTTMMMSTKTAMWIVEQKLDHSRLLKLFERHADVVVAVVVDE
jgi:hypothetical protein